MFFCLFVTLFFIQSISSFDVRYMNKAIDTIFSDDVLFGIMNKDFSEVPNDKENTKDGFRMTMFEDNDYISLRFIVQITIPIGNTNLNITQFAQAWYVTSLNQSRTQIVEYVNGENSNGIPLEVLINGEEEYVIFQNGSNVLCMMQNYSSFPTLFYTYYDTVFVTPNYGDYSVIWGPRLIDIYYAINDGTSFILGLDSFTEDLVLYVAYLNATYTQTVFVHDISYATFDTDNVNLPSHVTCSMSELESELYIPHSILSF